MASIVDRAHPRAIHPFHAAMLAGSLPLFLGALLSDYAYWTSYQIEWSNFASWLLAGALVFAAVALLCAVIDLFRGSRAVVYRTTAGTGGVVNVQPARPVEGRWVRLTSLRRSSPHRIGLSGFEVYGTAGDGRPAVAVLGPLADGGPPSRPAVIRAVRP